MNAMIDDLAAIIATWRKPPDGISPKGNPIVVVEPMDWRIAEKILQRLLLPTDWMIQAAPHYFTDDDETRTAEELAEDIFKEMIQAALDQYKE